MTLLVTSVNTYRVQGGCTHSPLDEFFYYSRTTRAIEMKLWSSEQNLSISLGRSSSQSHPSVASVRVLWRKQIFMVWPVSTTYVIITICYSLWAIHSKQSLTHISWIKRRDVSDYLFSYTRIRFLHQKKDEYYGEDISWYYSC